jgi:hypothetical protein
MSLNKYQECRVCGVVGDHDFHHWDYHSGRGVILCRECHSKVHDGGKAKPSDSMGDEWKLYAIKNLVEVHLENHASKADSELICERYNIALSNQGIVGRAIQEAGFIDRDSQYTV